MAGVHQRAHPRQVARFERSHRVKHALVLVHNVAAAAVDGRRQQPLVFLKLLHRNVAQLGNGRQRGLEQAHAFLALGAPLVVGAARQRAAGFGVADHQPRLLGKGNEAIVETATINQQRMVLAAQHADELVHDAAVDAYKAVLGALCDQCYLRSCKRI